LREPQNLNAPPQTKRSNNTLKLKLTQQNQNTKKEKNNKKGILDFNSNVRGKREPTARRQARAMQDKPPRRAGLVTCRWLYA